MTDRGVARVDGLGGIVAADAAITVLDAASSWAEGVLYIPATHRVRWSDIPRNRILEHDLATGVTSVYRADAEFANGRTLDLDGSVLQCSHGHRRVERDRGGVVVSLVDRWNGARFNSPNDVVVGPDGAIWFTDPSYGILFAREGHPGEREYGDHFVFRYDRASGRVTPVVTDVEAPNGLAFSPDGSILYVADSSFVGHNPAGGNRHVRAYDVTYPDGGARCKNGRVFTVMPVHVPDGLRVDVEGRVWATGGDGVHVHAPDGEHLGAVLLPEVAGNLCFGGVEGTELFVAATTSIYRVPTLTRDAAQRY